MQDPLPEVEFNPTETADELSKHFTRTGEDPQFFTIPQLVKLLASCGIYVQPEDHHNLLDAIRDYGYEHTIMDGQLSIIMHQRPKS